MYIRIATGLRSEAGTHFYEVLRHIEVPTGWDEMTEDEREAFVTERIAELEEECAYSEWGVVDSGE